MLQLEPVSGLSIICALFHGNKDVRAAERGAWLDVKTASKIEGAPL
jgi:hypothetical protein